MVICRDCKHCDADKQPKGRGRCRGLPAQPLVLNGKIIDYWRRVYLDKDRCGLFVKQSEAVTYNKPVRHAKGAG